MKRFFKILPVVLVTVLAMVGCRSHRTTVKHEETRWHRVTLDSTATCVDTTTRRDSVSLAWLTGALSLEIDSVDWHFEWDSVGQPARVTSTRRTVRRSGTSGTTTAAAVQVMSREEARYQRAVQDSVSHELTEDKRAETKSGSSVLNWLKVAGMVVLLALVVMGVVHLRKLTEKWSKRP